jgi:excisionase family DNA binding protein
MSDIRLISKAEAARLLDVDEKTVRRLVEAGVLREVQLGPRAWLVRAELVELVTGEQDPVGASP